MNLKLHQIRGMIPFLSAAFLNAFTDLGHKIVIQNTLLKTMSGAELTMYSSLIQAMILLPFLLVFSPAGYLSDKFPKQRIMQIAAFCAIPIILGILYAYHSGDFKLAFGLTFLLGLQAAIYSPAKYGYIKELAGPEQLAPANSALQSVSIVAILGGTVAYTLVFEHMLKGMNTHLMSSGQILQAVQWSGILLLIGAVVEWLMTLRLPKKTQTFSQMRFQWGHYLCAGYLRNNLKDALRRPVIWQSIFGLSIFYAVNQVMLSNFGAYMKESTGTENSMLVNGLMGLSGLGIILGSVFASKSSKSYIETGLIPLSAGGMSLCLLVFPFFKDPITIGILFSALGFFGGTLIVPLYALIQFNSRADEAGHIQASNNFSQTLFMVSFLMASLGLAKIGLSQQSLFLGLGLICLMAFVWTVKMLPMSLVRLILRMLSRTRYQMQVLGLNQMPAEGGVLLLGNHVSWFDWAMLQMASPRPVRYVMKRSIYEKWYLRWLMNQFEIIPISSGASREALKCVSDALNKGEVVAIFPEGHISMNGHLSQFKSGFEKAAEGTGAVILPFYLQGLWGSIYSYAKGQYRESSRGESSRLITIAFGKSLPETASAREVKLAVQELSIDAWKNHIDHLPTVAQSWLRTAKRRGSEQALFEADGSSLSSYRLIAAVLSFGQLLRPHFAKAQNIGLMLPPSGGGVIANLSVLLAGKTAVNLNYTSSGEIMQLCAQRAEIKTVLSSRKFEQRLQSKGFDLSLLHSQCEMVYLEDLKAQIRPISFVLNLCKAVLLPHFLLAPLVIKSSSSQNTAALLFSSGSEGVPKGVELSHANIVGNLKQVSSLINPDKKDVMLSNLPLFHAFGLTITTLLPLVEGIPLVCQADPTDAAQIGKLVARHKITLMCGTSTFLRIYAQSKRIHPLMFQSLRLVVAGAERLRPEVRENFREKFGLDIYEGYGTTETTPVASTNLPDLLLSEEGAVQVGHKKGTVGLPLPGSFFRIVDPQSYEDLPLGEAGMILIGGNQIMKGYWKDPEKTASVLLEKEGKRWYITGDKGKLDEDGFLTILDRYSRFAKIGGEMVSLSSVESAIEALGLGENVEVAAIAVADAQKGERIVLLLGQNQLDLGTVKERIQASALPPLYRPAQILNWDELPKLGSGKIDYVRAKAMVLEGL